MRRFHVSAFITILLATALLAPRANSQVAANRSISNKKSLGSEYLPLDHWAYPVIERAIAKGAIPDQFWGLRPWTRMAVADLLEQRRRRASEFTQDESSLELVRILEQEFAAELDEIEGDDVSNAQVTSVYTRMQGISGDSLRDGYHLGQTVVNDYGRPYGNGFNNVTGGSFSFNYDWFTVAMRGEFQRSAAGTTYPASAINTLDAKDRTDSLIAPSTAAQTHYDFLDTYAGAIFKSWDFTAGKQSIWWGPTDFSSMTFTNNIDPMWMGRLNRTVPFRFPWVFKYLGDARMDFFMARTQGHLFPAKPWIHGEKASLMPTKNLEFGFARTTVWTGVDRPFSLRQLINTYFSVGDYIGSNQTMSDPGDRRGEFDMRYRVPWVRNWLTVYMDSLVDDDPSPLAAPHNAAIRPGFYISHFPGLEKLDLRVEGAYTQPNANNREGLFFYWNDNYHDSYTNESMLIGDWVGREGIGGEAAATYWLTPLRSVAVSYRRHTIAHDFIPGGGNSEDYAATTSLHLTGSLFVTGGVQFESYLFPILENGRKHNFTTTVGLTLYPGSGKKFGRQ
jgi:hypothetical protein